MVETERKRKVGTQSPPGRGGPGSVNGERFPQYTAGGRSAVSILSLSLSLVLSLLVVSTHFNYTDVAPVSNSSVFNFSAEFCHVKV